MQQTSRLMTAADLDGSRRRANPVARTVIPSAPDAPDPIRAAQEKRARKAAKRAIDRAA